MTSYDIAVLGGGPAGYVAAIRAAQLGARVALIEAERLGGTCLNHGCIPTKTLLHNAEFLRELPKARQRGILLADPSVTLDLPAMMRHKETVVGKLITGITGLLKSYGIEVFQGRGTIRSDLKISVDSGSELTAKKIILAGGSEAIRPPIPGIESPKVLTSREILNLEALPEKLLIIGGGVIGVEIARIFNAFGSETVILELAERLVPFFDEEISKNLTLQLKKEKIQIQTGTKVARFQETASGLEVLTEEGKTFSGTLALVSTGRKANLSAIVGLEIKTERGFVWTDPSLETSIPGVFAPGDINGKCMLAHAAFQMAEIAVENAFDESGSKKEFRSRNIPAVLYGSPEAASVGWTESEAKQSGKTPKVGRFPFTANGRALAADQGSGFVKVVADAETEALLGVQMIGPSVSEIINEAAVLLSVGASVRDIAETPHGHPSCSEALQEAAADALGVAVHLPKKR